MKMDLQLDNIDVELDMEIQTAESDQNKGALESVFKAKTSHRMHYEAQVEVIKKQIGDLESVRDQLGLTQRKICQLLMVDPSAWTRWTRRRDRGGGQVPPHIYRALQWYMTLQEKVPGLTAQYFIGRDSGPANKAILQRLEDLEQTNLRLLSEKQGLESRVEKLSTQVQANRVGFYMVVLGALIMALAIYWQMQR
jgi:transcriptional regulator with XRE-family HTH domain